MSLRTAKFLPTHKHLHILWIALTMQPQVFGNSRQPGASRQPNNTLGDHRQINNLSNETQQMNHLTSEPRQNNFILSPRQANYPTVPLRHENNFLGTPRQMNNLPNGPRQPNIPQGGLRPGLGSNAGPVSYSNSPNDSTSWNTGAQRQTLPVRDHQMIPTGPYQGPPMAKNSSRPLVPPNQGQPQQPIEWHKLKAVRSF